MTAAEPCWRCEARPAAGSVGLCGPCEVDLRDPSTRGDVDEDDELTMCDVLYPGLLIQDAALNGIGPPAPGGRDPDPV